MEKYYKIEKYFLKMEIIFENCKNIIKQRLIYQRLKITKKQSLSEVTIIKNKVQTDRTQVYQN